MKKTVHAELIMLGIVLVVAVVSIMLDNNDSEYERESFTEQEEAAFFDEDIEDSIVTGESHRNPFKRTSRESREREQDRRAARESARQFELLRRSYEQILANIERDIKKNAIACTSYQNPYASEIGREPGEIYCRRNPQITGLHDDAYHDYIKDDCVEVWWSKVSSNFYCDTTQGNILETARSINGIVRKKECFDAPDGKTYCKKPTSFEVGMHLTNIDTHRNNPALSIYRAPDYLDNEHGKAYRVCIDEKDNGDNTGEPGTAIKNFAWFSDEEGIINAIEQKLERKDGIASTAEIVEQSCNEVYAMIDSRIATCPELNSCVNEVGEAFCAETCPELI